MSNAAVVARLADWFGRAGFRTTVQTVSESPLKQNLVARLGTGEGGLVLSGHTDTVPCDAERWASDPYRLDERDGRWFGLGSADMKCFFPIVLAALEGFDRGRLRRPVTLLATADEESSMNGARRLAEDGVVLGRYALIGEPTELTPVHAHKGILIGRIALTGRSGHSSDPAYGASALECMVDILTALRRWREDAAARYADAAFAVPRPTLNFGRIVGGDSPNRICAACELSFDVRLMPGMEIDETTAALAAIVQQACDEHGVEGALELPMAPLPPLLTPADSALVAALTELSGNAATTVAFATEGPFLNALGCESVVFGPGSIATAHQPDEHVDIARALQMVDIVRTLIERLCCDD